MSQAGHAHLLIGMRGFNFNVCMCKQSKAACACATNIQSTHAMRKPSILRVRIGVVERGLNALALQICKFSAFQTLHVDVQSVTSYAVLEILHNTGVGREMLLYGCFVLSVAVLCSQFYHFDCTRVTVFVLVPTFMVIPSSTLCMPTASIQTASMMHVDIHAWTLMAAACGTLGGTETGAACQRI